MGRWEMAAVKLLTCIVLALVVINVIIITHFQSRTRETTVIFSEVHKGSKELSDSDSYKVNKEHLRTRNNDNKQDNNQPNGDEQEKLRPDEEKQHSDGNDVKEIGDVTFNKRDSVNKAEEYEMKDDVIDAMINKIQAKQAEFFPSYFDTSSLKNLTRQLGAFKRKSAKQLSYYKKNPSKVGYPNWKRAHRNIRQFSLYDPDDPAIDGLLHDMVTLPIVEAEENDGGTEFKLTLTLKNSGRAIMKPMRWPREVEASPNHYIFDDMERHIAEIAAFQLDRILGFFRVPPTIGRRINITSELEPIVPKSVYKTIFNSPAGNVCFYGRCDYYCDSAHAFCGSPDVIEVSMMSYLPSRNLASRESWYQPWRRSYSKFRKAYWETRDDLCDKIRKETPYNNGKLLVDMIDSHTFDFLTGNKDRHSFLFFTEFRNNSFPIMYDNGRGFGRKTYDALSILAPLRQCCLIRKSTLLKYIKIYQGPAKLSDLMEEALARDPVAPVLLRGHLTALDRRLLIILRTVAKCLETHPLLQVIVDDRF